MPAWRRFDTAAGDRPRAGKVHAFGVIELIVVFTGTGVPAAANSRVSVAQKVARRASQRENRTRHASACAGRTQAGRRRRRRSTGQPQGDVGT